MTERISEQSDSGLTLTESLMKVRGDDWLERVSPMRSATEVFAGVTSVSKGQTPTHLAFLIGYMDGSQIALPK